MYIELLGAVGCTTTQTIKASQETLFNHGIGKNDTVVVHWAKPDDPRRAFGSEQIYIWDVTEKGISGFGASGIVREIGYDEISKVEYRKSRAGGPEVAPSDLAELLLNVVLCCGGP
jgi:hypothetical protein